MSERLEKIADEILAVVNKKKGENFGTYLHMGGKIAVLVVTEGATEEVAHRERRKAGGKNLKT